MSIPLDLNDDKRTVETTNVEGDSIKQGTHDDIEDMKRLGKIQQLRRNFGSLSIFGFACIILSTWTAILQVAAFGLLNGGTAGIIYMFIVVVFFFSLVNLSLAEMASMAPTAGGQYHWISEFAPRSKQRVLSYFIGWICSLAWQSGVAIGSFLSATQIQGLIVLNVDNYVNERWHATLLTIAIALWILLFNTLQAKYLPYVEILVLILYLGGYLCILVPLWVLGPRGNSHDIWTQFQNSGGWPNTGLATLVGLITPVTAFIGADAAVHMAEELRDASKTLPKVIVYTSIVNASLGFVMLITFIYTLGDLEAITSTPTGFPYMAVFYNVTGSKAATTAMSMILILSSVANAMTNMATASRQLWSFARDAGVPWNSWFAHVSPRLEIPLNALLATVTFTILFSLVNIGSTVAFNQILSLGLVTLVSSYILSIFCLALRRIRGPPLLHRKFNLGVLGLPINLLSLAFLCLVFVMSFFPSSVNPDVTTMNWSCLAYTSVLMLGAVYYIIWARHRYVGPVEYVAKSL